MQSVKHLRGCQKLLSLKQSECVSTLEIGGVTHSHGLSQDAAGAGQDNNDERVIMSEEQRDAVVQNMVESCRKDPQMRETFLGAISK